MQEHDMTIDQFYAGDTSHGLLPTAIYRIVKKFEDKCITSLFGGELGEMSFLANFGAPYSMPLGHLFETVRHDGSIGIAEILILPKDDGELDLRKVQHGHAYSEYHIGNMSVEYAYSKYMESSVEASIGDDGWTSTCARCGTDMGINLDVHSMTVCFDCFKEMELDPQLFTYTHDVSELLDGSYLTGSVPTAISGESDIAMEDSVEWNDWESPMLNEL
jgi:hypothetical protein